jgi:hypothetical protein
MLDVATEFDLFDEEGVAGLVFGALVATATPGTQSSTTHPTPDNIKYSQGPSSALTASEA